MAKTIYSEVIKQLRPQKSMADSLAKYFKNYSTDDMVQKIKKERKKLERF